MTSDIVNNEKYMISKEYMTDSKWKKVDLLVKMMSTHLKGEESDVGHFSLLSLVSSYIFIVINPDDFLKYIENFSENLLVLLKRRQEFLNIEKGTIQ